MPEASGDEIAETAIGLRTLVIAFDLELDEMQADVAEIRNFGDHYDNILMTVLWLSGWTTVRYARVFRSAARADRPSMRHRTLLSLIMGLLLAGCGPQHEKVYKSPVSRTWPNDPAKRAAAAFRSLLAPGVIVVTGGGAESGGPTDIAARGGGGIDIPGIKSTKERYRRYLVWARKQGWHVRALHPYVKASSGRVDGVGVDLELDGVQADVSVNTNHGDHYDDILMTVL